MHPQLTALGQAYFHQDFDMEADTPIGVVEKFRQLEAPESTAALRAEILSIVEAGLNDDDIAEIWFEEAGACYDPRYQGLSLQDWMHRMSETLTERH
ncbi:contact-dependent growth inhibition system immunity protein [Streptomyces sp. NPDC026665]|uniref:contact-dependent growth inhibition system immunity protein n=1 Tax=Streptomyces sp. NPDC026665 TaxID=3154798 RepID=UPI0033F4F3DF